MSGTEENDQKNKHFGYGLLGVILGGILACVAFWLWLSGIQINASERLNKTILLISAEVAALSTINFLFKQVRRYDLSKWTTLIEGVVFSCAAGIAICSAFVG